MANEPQKQSQKLPERVILSDNDVLMLMQAAELNAGSKAASVHTKQIYSALAELFERRVALPASVTTSANTAFTLAPHGIIWTSIPNATPKCPQCGEMYFSIPRMGIYHMCKDKAVT